MNTTEIKIRTINIIKKCAKEMSPELINVVSDNEFYETLDDILIKCKDQNIKHDGFVAIEATVWKLTYDKLCPQLNIDSNKKAFEYIKAMTKRKKWYQL